MAALDSTYGGKDATSYLTVVEANSWIRASKLTVTEWTSNEPKQEAALLTATRKIDALNWAGGRFFYAQLLQFPRTQGGSEEFQVNLRATGEPGGNFAVLVETDDWLRKQKLRVQQACCEQALYELRTQGINAHREAQFRGVGSQSRSARTGASFSYRQADMILCPEAYDFLREYAGTIRVVRG